MHYELSFQKKITVHGSKRYVTDCGWGGDVIRDLLLPSIPAKYGELQTGEEDWGWFVWYRRGGIRHAVDIFCDEPATGKFRLRVYATAKKFLIFWPETQTPELAELKDLVLANLQAWGCEVKVDGSA